MSRGTNVIVLVEGKTEQLFVRDVLAPYMGNLGIFLTATQLNKPGQKGGDVRFERAKKDIASCLKQRKDLYVSILIDYYGIGSDWPGLKDVRPGASPSDISKAICRATRLAVNADLKGYRSDIRFVPNVAVHEFEALLFSNPVVLAEAIQVKQSRIDRIIQGCGGPEAIDNSPQTAPSKRIEKLYSQFKKSTTGIDIAKEIGIQQMRLTCPVFNGWLERLESLVVN